MARQIVVPFAEDGDRTAIPDAAQPDGTVSFAKGYTFDYSRPIGSSPLAKNVERVKANALQHDITENIQAWQLNTYPEWYVDTAYPEGSRVRHDGGVWECITADAETEPGVGPDWLPVYDRGVIPVVDRDDTATTLLKSDRGFYIRLTSIFGSPVIDIETNAVNPIPIGAWFKFRRIGPGVATFAPVLGVTVNVSVGGSLSITQYQEALLIKVGVDAWDLRIENYQPYSVVADLALLSPPVNAVVSTKGCLTVGDGGHADFIAVDVEPDIVDGFSGILAANGLWWVLQPANSQFNLLQFGAVDGEDCDTAINLAKVASSTRKMKVLVPAGTYFHNGFVVTIDDVNFVGSDRDLAILKLADGVNTHGMEIAGDCNNVNLLNLTIDQNRAGNLTGGHGIRFGGSTNVLLDNVRIANCRAYGIGMQAGTQQHIKILNTTIAEAGLDGIDIKDFNEDNDDIYIGNLTVINHGLDETAKPAIDWRGKLTVDGLHVSTTAAETIGIRARLESTQGKAASGNVDNITLICNGTPTNANAIVLEGSAVAIDIPRQVNITNVRAVGYQRIGLFGNRTIANIRNVSAEGITGDCFLTFCAGVTVEGLRVTSCDRVFSAQADTTGFKIRDAVVESVANASLFAIASGATNVDIDDCDFPSGKTFSDASGNETIRLTRIKNYPLAKKVLQSAALAIDSTGNKSFSIAHGLGFAPRLQDIQLTISRDVGAAVDHRIQLLQVDTVNGANITGTMNVSTASATAGATVKVTVKVETKYSI